MCYLKSGIRFDGLILKNIGFSKNPTFGLPGNIAVKLEVKRSSAKKLKGYETTHTTARI